MSRPFRVRKALEKVVRQMTLLRPALICLAALSWHVPVQYHLRDRGLAPASRIGVVTAPEPDAQRPANPAARDKAIYFDAPLHVGVETYLR